MLPNWCSVSRMAFMKQTWSVRVENNRPQLCLLWAAVHPIRRHCTSSDRVHRDVTGASRRIGCRAVCCGAVGCLLELLRSSIFRDGACWPAALHYLGQHCTA